MTPLQALTEDVYQALYGHAVWPLVVADAPMGSETRAAVAVVVRALQSVGAEASVLIVRVTHQAPGDTMAHFERHYAMVDGQPIMMGWTGMSQRLDDEQAARDWTYKRAEGQACIGLGLPESRHQAIPEVEPHLLDAVCEAAAPELAKVAAFMLSQNTISRPLVRSGVRL